MNRFDRLGQRADLVYFDQDTVGHFVRDPTLQTSRVGNEQIVTDQLNTVADLFGQQFPSVPIVFVATILDRADRIAIGPVGQKVNHLSAVQLLAIDRIAAIVFVVKLGCRNIEGDPNLLASSVTRFVDRGHDQIERFAVGTKVGSKATFVAHGSVESLVREYFFEIVKNLSSAAKCIRKPLKP